MTFSKKKKQIHIRRFLIIFICIIQILSKTRKQLIKVLPLILDKLIETRFLKYYFDMG